MDEWTPILALPNLDMRGTLECSYAAIVGPADPRVERLRAAHPKLTTFLSKFSGQFREQVWPSLLLLRADAPQSCFTAEAVSAFRDVLSMSVVPYARTTRLRFDRASGLAFTNTFQFYPWMLDKQFEEMLLVNPAQLHAHLLDEFEGQSFPEQLQASIMWNDIDVPLARELLGRWTRRFSGGPVAWKDKALFRSLNMANEAGRIPALAASVFYDTGRSLALWVSAHEILAHPGGTGQSNFGTVTALLESVKSQDPGLAAPVHSIAGRIPQQKQLATWVCRKVYDLRNDFLHGNDVDGNALLLNGRPVIDFAACLYRLALTGFWIFISTSRCHLPTRSTRLRNSSTNAASSGNSSPLMRTPSPLRSSAAALPAPISRTDARSDTGDPTINHSGGGDRPPRSLTHNCFTTTSPLRWQVSCKIRSRQPRIRSDCGSPLPPAPTTDRSN